MSTNSSKRTATRTATDTLSFNLQMDPQQLSKPEITSIRVLLGVSGVIALVAGVVILAWPEATLTIVALIFGLYFLVAGVVRAGRGIFVRGSSAGGRVLNILLGVLLLIAGIVTIRNPLDSIVVLALVIGVSWIVEGVAALVETAPDSSRWMGTLFGAIGIVAGIVMLLSPMESIGVLVIVGGIFLVVSGAIQIGQAFTFGRETRTEKSAPVMRDTD